MDVLLHTEYQVVINLHHEGIMISSRETKGGSCAVWNSSFLFDLPTGEISQLRVMLEFVIMQVKDFTALHSVNNSTCDNRADTVIILVALQNQALSKGKVLGRVKIGNEAADAGRAHWRDVCNLQVEQARWHTVQPEPL